MKKNKLWIIALCYRCKSDFETGGHILVKRGWQKSLKVCEFCQVGRGIEYVVLEKNGGGKS